MNGECNNCGEHALECLCPLPLPRRWIDKEEAKKMFPLDILGIDEDKNSTTYFMTEMTQEEFEERTNGIEKVPYEFNKIKR